MLLNHYFGISSEGRSIPEIKRNVCKICNSPRTVSISVYKHIWTNCQKCGCAGRSGKNRYALDPILKVILANTKKLSKIPKLRSIHLFFQTFDRNENGVDLYDHYLEDNKTSSHGTPWEGVSDLLYNDITEKITRNTKAISVLDISGGPGYVAKELSGKFKSITVSEFSPSTVSRMISLLHLDTFKFDFNKENLNNLTSKKFDLIMSRHSLNFVENLEDFCGQLEKKINSQGYVYLSFVLNNPQSIIRWQMEEYIYRYLFSPEYVSSIFKKFGFKETHRAENRTSKYFENKKVYLPIYLISIVANGLFKVFLQPRCRSITMIFCKTK